MQIKGHAAIVTGGGSGLGAATAVALAAGGAKVAVLDLNKDAAAEVAQKIGGVGIGCDVTDAASLEAAFATARQAHGPARIAVACAGVATAGRIVGKEGALPLDAFAKVVAINLTGTFNLLRLAAADMAKLDALSDGERGIVIFTASVAAFEGQIGQAAYAASKGGVVSLVLPAARELARSGIRVLAISPGLFATPMLFTLPQPVQDSLAATLPFPTRFGQPEEFAKLALHMIDNVVLNGEVIRLDAALRMAPR